MTSRKRIFVTGTDTDVGKTVVAAVLTLGMDAYYWKPIQAGLEPCTDTDAVRRWTGLPSTRLIPETYRLREPMSPHAAAEIERVEIDVARIVDTELPSDRPVVIEGAGGLMVPLNRRALLIDLIGDLGVPVILVARTGLGTLNHTLLSVSELRRRTIPLLGVVLNGDEHVSNHSAIEEYGGAPVLGRVPRLGVIDAVSLRRAFDGLALP